MPDIHEILLIAQADAPPTRNGVDDIVAAGRRRRRRALAQRIGGAGVVGVAVATVGVLTAVNLALPNDHRANTLVLPASPPAPTVPAPAPPFTFTFAGYGVANYRVLAPDVVTPVYQQAGVLRDTKAPDGKVNTEYAGTLTVYQPKQFNPQPFKAGTSLTVQGRDAFQTEAKQKAITSATRDKYTFKETGTTITTLAWQYAPDSWATLSGEGLSPFTGADEVQVAEGFTVAPGGPVKAKVPFRTGYLPAGYTLKSIDGQSLVSQQRGIVTFTYANAAGKPSVVISILWVDTPPPDAVKRKSRCNPGQHFCVTTLPGGEFYFVVEDPSLTLPDQELTKVADALTFANIKDASTWYPAAPM